MKRIALLAPPLWAALWPTLAHAAPVSDVEVPAIVLDQGDASAGPAADEALDLANIVQSAAKGVTTVQEAPAIVTVVTADEIKDRQFQDLEQLADTIPGWQRVAFGNGTFATPVVRGQVQAVQYLQDGLSLFDPFVNVPGISRVVPMETVKRVELITGPGGVLWGSNSLLGIFNVITKDADDVDGVEMGATLGDGNGDRSMGRLYAMVGAPNVLGGKLKVFAHGSVETYQGGAFQDPLLLFHGAIPQPNAANIYGPLTTTDEAQSIIVNLDAKITLDKLQLRVSAPFGRKYSPMGFSGDPVRHEPTAACKANPGGPACFDPLGTSGDNRGDQFDRFAVLEYRTRLAEGRAGVTVRAYAQQFVRGFDPLQVLAPSSLLPGGLGFKADLTSYRAGGALDGDIELGHQLRIQYGGEAFKEWKPDDTNVSGTGNLTDLISPVDLRRVPLQCPREYSATAMGLVPVPGCPLVFAFPASRTVLGAYVNPQWRPTKNLIFDLGGRLQLAPTSLGSLNYPLTTTVAGAVVWSFIPSWYLKLDYTQGFRPPVFNDTVSNGEGLQIGGNPNLKVETSDALQAEINARIFKGDRRIRELAFRIDGSYTRVNDLIQVTSGQYTNAGARDIASVEFLGKLYIQGGHRLELGYTWMRGEASDKGLLLALPEHVFNLAGVWNLVSGKLSATTNLKVSGATEDPNRLVDYRTSTYDANGNPTNLVTVPATDLVLDRLPPIAELSLGLTWTPRPKVQLRATLYDALAGHFYQPDVFFDYEPHLEYLPNPYEGMRAYVSALIQY